MFVILKDFFSSIIVILVLDMKAIVVFGLIFVFTVNLSLDSSATHLTGRHRETIHELAPLNKITPPCKAGLLPYQNCKKPTMNGCG